MNFKTDRDAYAYAAKHKLEVKVDNTLARGKRVLDVVDHEGMPSCLVVPVPKKENPTHAN